MHRFASLNAVLQKYHISRKLRVMIMQANVKTTPAMLLVAAAVLAMIGLIGVSLFFDIPALQIAAALEQRSAISPSGFLMFKKNGPAAHQRLQRGAA